jgi:CysZ protein
MINAIIKTINQFFEPSFWRVFVKSLVVTVTLLGLSLWAGLEMASSIPTTGYGWLDWTIDAITPFGAFLAALVLYPALSSLVMGLFLDDIALAVEQRHYPNDQKGTPIGVGRSLKSASQLAVTMVLVNLVALPFYLIFLFFPLMSIGLYYLINGYMLNKEYFEQIALRHGDAALHKALRRKHGGKLFLAGCAIAFLYSVPILNLTTPLLATGLMVHLFKDFNQHQGDGRVA